MGNIYYTKLSYGEGKKMTKPIFLFKDLELYMPNAESGYLWEVEL